MPNTREKLIELLREDIPVRTGGVLPVTVRMTIYGAEELANHLIAHGVTIQKFGQWEDARIQKWIYAHCPICNTTHDVKSNYCPNCGANMTFPKITDQTMDALEKMGEKAHGGE